LPYALSCGLDRADGLETYSEIRVPVTITDVQAPNFYKLEVEVATLGMQTHLVVTQLTAAMFPVMSYGINEDNYYANGLKDSITAEAQDDLDDGFAFTNVTDFSKFMNIMRMMGYDVTAHDTYGNKNISNWADNASGRFLYTDINTKSNVHHYYIKHENILQRPNNWIEIGQKRGSITLTYEMTELRMKLFSGDSDMQVTGKPIFQAVSPSLSPSTAMQLKSGEGIKLIPLKRVKQQDFRVAQYEMSRPLPSQPGLPSVPNTLDTGVDPADSETPLAPADVPEEGTADDTA
jgi:hypothetical protein